MHKEDNYDDCRGGGVPSPVQRQVFDHVIWRHKLPSSEDETHPAANPRPPGATGSQPFQMFPTQHSSCVVLCRWRRSPVNWLADHKIRRSAAGEPDPLAHAACPACDHGWAEGTQLGDEPPSVVCFPIPSPAGLSTNGHICTAVQPPDPGRTNTLPRTFCR